MAESSLFPTETLKALEEEYRQLRHAGLSHQRASAMIKAAMTKAIPAAVNIIMDDIKKNGIPLDEARAMADAGWFDSDPRDSDPREAREIERHQREEEQ